jgi:hypothetical protein
MILLVAVATLSLLGPLLLAVSRLLPNKHVVLIPTLQKAGRIIGDLSINVVFAALIALGLSIITVFLISEDLTIAIRIVTQLSEYYSKSSEEDQLVILFHLTVPFCYLGAMAVVLLRISINKRIGNSNALD